MLAARSAAVSLVPPPSAGQIHLPSPSAHGASGKRSPSRAGSRAGWAKLRKIPAARKRNHPVSRLTGSETVAVMLDQLDEVDMVKPFDRIINLLTPKRRWAQFSLGTMFVVVTGICVWLAFQVNRAHRQAVAVIAIRRMGGEVYYEYQYLETDGETNLTINAVPTAPPWLLNSLGEDFVYRAVAVTPNYTHFPGTFFGPALNHNDFSDRTDDAMEHIGHWRACGF
jgi:hypothetical protein